MANLADLQIPLTVRYARWVPPVMAVARPTGLISRFVVRYGFTIELGSPMHPLDI